MIWIITSTILYLVISGASLFLICSGENNKDSYFDIRNIFVSLIWPIVLFWAAIVSLAKMITNKKEVKVENN
jgi:hypothetical protein